MEVVGAVASTAQLVTLITSMITTIEDIQDYLKNAPRRICERQRSLASLETVLAFIENLQLPGPEKLAEPFLIVREKLNELQRLLEKNLQCIIAPFIVRLWRLREILRTENTIIQTLITLDQEKATLVLHLSAMHMAIQNKKLSQIDKHILRVESNIMASTLSTPGRFSPFRKRTTKLARHHDRSVMSMAIQIKRMKRMFCKRNTQLMVDNNSHPMGTETSSEEPSPITQVVLDRQTFDEDGVDDRDIDSGMESEEEIQELGDEENPPSQSSNPGHQDIPTEFWDKRAETVILHCDFKVRGRMGKVFHHVPTNQSPNDLQGDRYSMWNNKADVGSFGTIAYFRK